jgi:type IV pilus assembly protein PilB
MAELDIAEKRVPQDGRIKLRVQNRNIDLRVATLPVIHGEKIVLRILDQSNLNVNMETFGFQPESMKRFLKAIESPYGMVLVTGPTGSGKTTTLYSAISRINKTEVNIMTAEDPVEYNLVGINQLQIHEDIGLSFASALRAFLRQDPDVIMVGEIRDFETAEIAVKAALTGHLVLSTVHTNDAPSTINRLLNMGIEPFLISSSVNLIMAQRLARVVCPKCREPRELPASVLVDLGVAEEQAQPITAYHGIGCQHCAATGFRGRTALYEVMSMTEALRELILSGGSASDLKRQAMADGMKTLRQSGVEKICEGLTTVEEVMRVTMAD